MRLACQSHLMIEEFLRAYFKDPNLQLPVFRIYTGTLGLLLEKLVRVGAITVGRCVLVSPRCVLRNRDGKLFLPAGLTVHEAVHVLQYRQTGFGRFLISYCRGFWKELRRESGWGRKARSIAYLRIPQERDAQAAEYAFQKWREQQPIRRLVLEEKVSPQA